MKNTLLLFGISFFLSTTVLFAQTTEAEGDLLEEQDTELEGWQTGGLFSLGFSQVSLTNWAAGGQGSLAGNLLVALNADYSKGSFVWNNAFELGYGLMRQGDESLVKTDDKIDLTSKLGRQASEHWYYAGLLNFRTQMMPGYNHPDDEDKISDLLAPAYLLGAIGMDYKPAADFSLFLSPATAKITIVNDQRLADAGAFGVDPGSKSRSEFGGYVRATYRTDIRENITLQSRLDLFSNYTDKPQNIDVNWENLLLMRITQYITVSFATHLIYDDDIKIGIDSNDDGEIDKFGPRVQFKQILGIGLSYSL